MRLVLILFFALLTAAKVYVTYVRIKAIVWTVDRICDRIPTSVNYKLTVPRHRRHCSFCVGAVNVGSDIELIHRIKHCLRMLKRAGMQSITFEGDPMLHPWLLMQMVIFCYQTLDLRSVNIVATTSPVGMNHLFFYGIATYVDTFFVHCNSFEREGLMPHLLQVAGLCQQHEIRFGIRTVVSRSNLDQDMNLPIQLLRPSKWHCVQVEVDINGEGPIKGPISALAGITNKEFKEFCNRHRRQKRLVALPRDRPEKNACKLLDEDMRFVERKTLLRTRQVLEVGVRLALLDLRKLRRKHA